MHIRIFVRLKNSGDWLYTMGIDLTILNCTQKNGKVGKFCYCILPQLKKNKHGRAEKKNHRLG